MFRALPIGVREREGAFGLPLRSLVAAGLLLVPAACTDLGDPVAPRPMPPPAGSAPTVTGVEPARTYVGDRATVLGTEFGTDADAGAVLFDGASGDVAADVVTWEPDRIVVVVPDGAQDGEVRVRVGETISGGVSFEVAPEVSYAADVVPLFQTYGCVSCHGGINDLNVTPHAALLSGDSDHGPVVVPGDRGASLIWLKVRPSPPVGERMPQGGPFLSDAEILLLGDWIDQGARDN